MDLVEIAGGDLTRAVGGITEARRLPRVAAG